MATTLAAVAVKSLAPNNPRVSRAVEALPKIPTNLSDLERGGSALAGIAVTAIGFDGKGPGLASILAGGYLLYRASTGHCAAYQAMGVSTAPKLPANPRLAAEKTHLNQVSHSVIVNKPVGEVYRFWHDFRNLPKFMTHLIRVDVHDGKNSHWVAKGPLGMQVEWDAITTADVVNREIAWRSTEKADVDTTGSVTFKELPAGRGTEIKLTMSYAPPGGKAGVLISKLFGDSPDAQIRADLRGVKQLLEAGEMPTVKGQPTGR